MSDFRPETFIEFVRVTKPLWFIKIIWVGALFLSAILFIGFKNNFDVFWNYLIFFTLALMIQMFFTYWMTYKIYNLGRKAFMQVKNRNLKIIVDVEVFISGFDLFSKKTFFNINKPIYDFNQVDLIFAENSLIMLGKLSQFGAVSFAAPVELLISTPQTSASKAKIINWEEKNEKISIEIKDDYYATSFKIEFKSHQKEVKLWLLKHIKYTS